MKQVWISSKLHLLYHWLEEQVRSITISKGLTCRNAFKVLSAVLKIEYLAYFFQANSFLVPDRNVSFWISAVGQLEAEMEMRFVALFILNDNINLLTMISMT